MLIVVLLSFGTKSRQLELFLHCPQKKKKKKPTRCRRWCNLLELFSVLLLVLGLKNQHYQVCCSRPNAWYLVNKTTFAIVLCYPVLPHLTESPHCPSQLKHTGQNCKQSFFFQMCNRKRFLFQNERNKCVNQIQASKQKSAEMKEKIRILANEIEILRTTVSNIEK